jgi:hypothetical protein
VLPRATWGNRRKHPKHSQAFLFPDSTRSRTLCQEMHDVEYLDVKITGLFPCWPKIVVDKFMGHGAYSHQVSK